MLAQEQIRSQDLKDDFQDSTIFTNQVNFHYHDVISFWSPSSLYQSFSFTW